MSAFGFRFRQLGYDLSENLLVRPAGLLLLHVVLALSLVALERNGTLDGGLFALEPGTAQVMLGTIAGATMTVVSVVYSILLVALSLASMQFSTRILAGFMRDRTSQNTLGLFVGTFVYSLTVLREVQTDPAWVPGIAVFGATALSVGSLGALVYFIHHIVRSIQANHIVERIAHETELMIDAVFPEALAPGEEPAMHRCRERPGHAAQLNACRSGYVQLIDLPALAALVGPGMKLTLTRGMGQFMTRGAPMAWVEPASAATPALAAAVDRVLDLGPMRTMQDDVEFGFRQIVDIALKAVSPAVNDPSTAATCADQLGRLLVQVAGRRAPQSTWTAGTGTLEVPTTNFAELVQLAVDQLRQYTRGDMAIALRLLRMLADVASVTSHRLGKVAILEQVDLIEAGLSTGFLPAERVELLRRLAAVRALCHPHDAPSADTRPHPGPPPAS